MDVATDLVYLAPVAKLRTSQMARQHANTRDWKKTD